MGGIQTHEKAIRDQLAICAGDEAVQRVEDGRIVIEIVPGRYARSLAGVLREHVGRWPADESWEGGRTDVIVGMLVRARTLAGRPFPDALIVAAAIGADAVALATFDRGQARYGFPVAMPSGGDGR